MAEAATPTVMVVEDDPLCTYLMQRYVTRSGLRMVSAAQGQEALTLARRERPAVVVLDVTLPGMNGEMVLQALKADRATRDIPVLMCSGWSEARNWAEAGADGYLQKPVRYNDFLAALANVGVRQETWPTRTGDHPPREGGDEFPLPHGTKPPRS